MSRSTILLPFQPATMSRAQQAAVSYLARYSGLFAWCEDNGLDPLVEIQRAHVEFYIRNLGDRGLMDSSIVTMMHGIRGYFRPGTRSLEPPEHYDRARSNLGRHRVHALTAYVAGVCAKTYEVIGLEYVRHRLT